MKITNVLHIKNKIFKKNSCTFQKINGKNNIILLFFQIDTS